MRALPLLSVYALSVSRAHAPRASGLWRIDRHRARLPPRHPSPTASPRLECHSAADGAHCCVCVQHILPPLASACAGGRSLLARVVPLNHGSRRRLRLAAGDGAAAGARRGELVRWYEREDGPAGRARTAHTSPHGPVGAHYRVSAPFAASRLAAPLRNAAPCCATRTTRALKVPPASVYVRRDGSYAGKRGDPYHEAPRAPVPWRARYTPLATLAHTLRQHRLVFRRDAAGTSSLFTWAASCTS